MLRKMKNDIGAFDIAEIFVTVLILGIISTMSLFAFKKMDAKKSNETVNLAVIKVVGRVHEGLNKYPDATYFAVTDDAITQAPRNPDGKVWGMDYNENGKLTVWVGTSQEDAFQYLVESTLLDTTNVSVILGDKPGTFIVTGTDSQRGDYLAYDSRTGVYSNK